VDTADNGTTVTVLDGATVVGTTTVANGAWSDNITLTGTGLNVLTATDTNAGGTGTSNAVDYTLALPPPPPSPTPPHAPTISGSLSSKDIETLSGKAPDGSIVTVFEGTTKLGTTIASASGAWHYATTKLADGHYDFDASDTLAGLTSALSETIAVTVATVGHGHHNSSDFGH
jgi:hypothetical protein